MSLAGPGFSSVGLRSACFAGPSLTQSSVPHLTDPANPEAVKADAFRSAETREKFLQQRHDLVPVFAQPSELEELAERLQPENHI